MRNASCQRSNTLGGMLAVSSLCLAMSCESRGTLTQQAAAVKRGDSSARAIQLLGTPDDSQSEDDDEVLQYCKSKVPVVVSDSGEYVLVWLYKDVVTGVATYHRLLKGPGSCATGFKAVHWEDAPDRIAEVHQP